MCGLPRRCLMLEEDEMGDGWKAASGVRMLRSSACLQSELPFCFRPSIVGSPSEILSLTKRRFDSLRFVDRVCQPVNMARCQQQFCHVVEHLGLIYACSCLLQTARRWERKE